jgi:predicted DNA-binding protein YlxM (UPF0122 family)
MKLKHFFSSPRCIAQRQYEALRAFYVEEFSAAEAARRFGYTLSAFYSMMRDFKKLLERENPHAEFFAERRTGRKPKDATGEINALIIGLRKRYLSVPDIKAVLDVQGYGVSEKYVYNVIEKDGFARLPRRDSATKKKAFSAVKIKAPKSEMLEYAPETFTSQGALGVMCLLPYLERYRIDQLIEGSAYPETNAISRLSSILSFAALKLSSVRRYTADDAWCFDRGLGLFAGLNVLPKAAWFTSYSHRVTRKMNRSFLKGLHEIWSEAGLLSDTANLDFTSIPYYGDDSHLENNWSGSRNKSLASILTLLASDPDSGIITYGDTNVRHLNKSQVVLEFLDFYKEGGAGDLKYLVFDSGFTTYENLARLDPDVKFLTIRRRGRRIVGKLDRLPASAWKKVRVPDSSGKGRTIRVNDSCIAPKDYGKPLRQIAITGHGKIKPALLITNDFDKPLEELIRKYARRWLVEKNISEQIEFFHLNKVSSSMVIKVDFDLTMSILANNLLRVFAMDLEGYFHNTAQTLFDQFINNSGSVEIKDDRVEVMLKKKRNLPALLTAMEQFGGKPIRVMGNRKFSFSGETRS